MEFLGVFQAVGCLQVMFAVGIDKGWGLGTPVLGLQAPGLSPGLGEESEGRVIEESSGKHSALAVSAGEVPAPHRRHGAPKLRSGLGILVISLTSSLWGL